MMVNLYACKCSSEITNIFNTIENHIIPTNVQPTENAILNTLIPQIETDKASIDKQNEYLEKLLRAEQLKSLEASKLVFQLEKLLNLDELN